MDETNVMPPGERRVINLLDFVKDVDSLGVEACLAAYRSAKEQAEQERRARFSAFSFPADLQCPASRLYHRESRYAPESQLPLSPEESAALVRTRDYKRYPGSVEVALPADLPPLDVSIEDVIRTRRSRNRFSAAPIRLDELVRLLALGGGVTENDVLQRRAAPSAGALYPIEIYPWVFSVEGVPPALYHYAILTHTLEHVRSPTGWNELWPVLDPGCEGCTPAVAFVLTARLPRVQAKYAERGYRFALMECGHIGQNLLLVATALGFNALPAGGFFDAGLNFLLGVDGHEEVAAYVILVGRP